ncbi:hypothetical protein BTA51_22095 [Hahella sp. CCB-MM4]|uniref:hypothetical protein n=1 Tax=Hahella sp. (strain CCB-MM4) TaxID=1926491 RepID=UPI000B9AEC77|nr:hypothetical protein [Hahella sp. CCB-MM4]OZG71076.1 hypothetical protein BTA51_22095 [Hahella sp. CCB-MM4]
MDQIELSKKIEEILYPLLKGLGYEYLGVEDISTQAIPKWLKGTFRNSSAARTVEVGYIPRGVGPSEVLKCHIADLNFKPDDFDYTSTNQISVPTQKISELHKDLDDRVCIILGEIAAELKENFNEVLSGEVFETEHIDWQGLK